MHLSGHKSRSHKAFSGLFGNDTGPYGRKTLAHPEYEAIQSMWHPTHNEGKQPADVTHGSTKKVWLQCPGCGHGCGRKHEWEARATDLTKRGGGIVCPSCESKGGSFCECQSVAADPTLSAEWHPVNPTANQVATRSNKKFLWKCPEGHAPYEASCQQQFNSNSGCPACFQARTGKQIHPSLSDGRPDLAKEWDAGRNDKSPSEVTLGSAHKAWWRCSKNPEHLWQERVIARAVQGDGCQQCRGVNPFKLRKFGSAQ